MYNLRTIVSVGGQPLDVKDTRFGFREWGVSADKIKYTLNGIVWHLWAEIGTKGNTPQEWLADYRRKNQRTSRYVTAGQASNTAHFWLGLENQEALDFFDAGGVVIRRNTSPLDGEVIGYKFIEDDEETRKKQGGSEIKMALMQNWRDTCVAQVRAERNHPSIQIWTIENEFAYINLINLLGNSPNMDNYEREIIKTSNAVMETDPTRSVMIDGGGATKFNELPTHGDHYVFNQNETRYPDLAYQPFPEGGGRGRWMWDQKRPRFLGEDYFATGINPANYSMWGGKRPSWAKSRQGRQRASFIACFRKAIAGAVITRRGTSGSVKNTPAISMARIRGAPSLCASMTGLSVPAKK
jgi:beta-galactosidase